MLLFDAVSCGEVLVGEGSRLEKWCDKGALDAGGLENVGCLVQRF